MWTVFKVFISMLLLFYVLVFWPQGIWDLSPLTMESNPHTLHWKAKSQLLDYQGGALPFFCWGVEASTTDCGLGKDSRLGNWCWENRICTQKNETESLPYTA